MKELPVLFSLEPQLTRTVTALRECNAHSARYGLTLSEQQLQTLAAGSEAALQAAGRVGIGPGILPQLALAFCDSPFILPENYAATLAELQELFYYFKNDSLELLADDELVAFMRDCFNGECQGSLEYLSGVSLEALCRRLRGGRADADEA